MRQVEDVLVVGVAVDRHHRPVPEAEVVAHDLHHRREAVRRARRVGDDVVLRRVVLLVVHAEHDRDVLALRGRRDDDLLRAAGDVLPGVVGVRELAGGLEHHVDAEEPSTAARPDPSP